MTQGRKKGGFFLTIEDVTKSTGEPEGYLFHNMVHHPGVGMALDNLRQALAKFGVSIPQDLATALTLDLASGTTSSTAAHGSVELVELGAPALRVLEWKIY